MKALIKVLNMKTGDDVNKIRMLLSNREGIFACQIKRDKGEVDVVFDSYFVKSDEIKDLIEDLGYTVI